MIAPFKKLFYGSKIAIIDNFKKSQKAKSCILFVNFDLE